MSSDLVIASGAVVGAAWAAKKILGTTFDAMGGDLASFYRAGVDRILASACRKVNDIENGKSANLRVAHDILRNGAFCADEFVLEYFGGLLASSRSSDGWKDDATPFVDIVKSLSSSQLTRQLQKKCLKEPVQPHIHGVSGPMRRVAQVHHL